MTSASHVWLSLDPEWVEAQHKTEEQLREAMATAAATLAEWLTLDPDERTARKAAYEASPAGLRARHVERCIHAARERHNAIYEAVLAGLPAAIRETIEREVAIATERFDECGDPDRPIRDWLDEISPDWRDPS